MKKRPHEVDVNRAYHDRVAPRYDDVYKGRRWEAWHELSWAGLKRFIPNDLSLPVIDLGCGTGKYGLRLAKSGFKTTLSDLSTGMLEVCRQKAQSMGLANRVEFVQADVVDLSVFSDDTFGMALAQGDVLSFATRPSTALREVRRILKPAGVLVGSVDQTYAALAHYAEKKDLDGLKRLIDHGDMEWLARDPRERFPVHTFSPESLRTLLEESGFEVLDLFGKTVLPFKGMEALFEDAAETERILALEKKLCRKPSAMGLASHLQVAARVKKG